MVLMPSSFKDLLVWRKAVDLVTEVYRATRDFPREEIYGLTSQLRRSAVSIPSNIAEGQSRRTSREFRQFLGTARGSLAELETQIMIAENLGYLSLEVGKKLKVRVIEVGKMLNGLITAISSQDPE